MPNRIFSLIVILTLFFSSGFLSAKAVHPQAQLESEFQTGPEFSISPFGISPLSLATNLENISSITGAYYVQESHELVILGIDEPGYPKLRLDDFIVALRAMYANDYPAVSIDPGEDETVMDVSYWGATENTHFGSVMFEADRLLKILSMGRDNVTNQPVPARVKDFQTYLQRVSGNYSEGEQSEAWFRMWFEPVDVTLLTTTDKQAILFQSPSMTVKTEYLDPQYGKDPNAEAFVEHINNNFADYAKNYPVLVELRQLEQWLLVAKWMRDNDVPIDLAFLNTVPEESFETPATTPTITVFETFVNGDHLISLSLYGGVDFKLPKNNYQSSQAVVDPFVEAAKTARPDSSTIQWQTEIDSVLHQAVAMSPTRTTRAGSFTKTELDLGLSQSLASLAFSRYYDSFSQAVDSFSFGWKPWPFELTFPNRIDALESQPRQIDIRDYDGHAVRTFHLSVENETGNLIYYAPWAASQSELKRNTDGSFLWYRHDSTVAKFDENGRLEYIEDVTGQKLQYFYAETGQLDHIQNSAGELITFEYDAKNNMIRASGPSGECKYAYDSKGDLVTVTNSNGNIRKYTYDQNHRLTKIADGANKLFIQNEYDALGRVTSQLLDGVGYAVEYSPGGEALKITNKDDPNNLRNYEYDELGRLISIEQTEKPSIRYSYDDQGHFPSTFKIDNQTFEATYDWRNRLNEFKSASRGDITFHHTVDGKLSSMIGQQGEIINFERDESGVIQRIVTNLDQPENVYIFEREAGGQLRSIKAPDGRVQIVDSLKQIVAETNKPGIELFNVGDKILLAVLTNVDGTIREIEIGEDQLIQAALFTDPEALLLSNLSLAEKFEGSSDLLSKVVGSLIASDAVIVGNSDLKNMNFNKVFPNQAVIRYRSKDAGRAALNIKRMEETILSPADTAIINGIPASSKELQSIQVTDDYSNWKGIQPLWTQASNKYQFKAKTGASAFYEALQTSPNVVVIIAHADGNTIFWPDGTQTTSTDIAQLKADIERNQPLVMLFSCETAKLDSVPNGIVDSLLDAGARGVIAPTTSIEASGKSLDFFQQVLLASSQGQNILQAFRRAEIYVDYDMLELWARILKPLS